MLYVCHGNVHVAGVVAMRSRPPRVRGGVVRSEGEEVEGVTGEEWKGSEGAGGACVLGGSERSDLEGSHVASSPSDDTWSGHYLK